jgi:hypothetical protein
MLKLNAKLLKNRSISENVWKNEEREKKFLILTGYLGQIGYTFQLISDV